VVLLVSNDVHYLLIFPFTPLAQPRTAHSLTDPSHSVILPCSLLALAMSDSHRFHTILCSSKMTLNTCYILNTIVSPIIYNTRWYIKPFLDCFSNLIYTSRIHYCNSHTYVHRCQLHITYHTMHVRTWFKDGRCNHGLKGEYDHHMQDKTPLYEPLHS
jgi:hypothetical protein